MILDCRYVPCCSPGEWVPPHRCKVQVRCPASICTPDGVPGMLVMASTVDENGWCAKCARSPADDEGRELRLLP